MQALRRLLVVISVLLAGSAWAVTPGQRALLFGGIKPVFSVDLTQGVLPSQISFSRASNATYFDASGVLQTASTNVARFDHNQATPFASLGLLIEEQRTNVVLQNRNLSNASWTKTNVTAAQDQTGIDGVANSASSILATAGNGTALQAITLASSQRFQTAYVQRITGSGVVNMTTDGGATWTAITIPGAGTWGRVSIPAQTVTNPSVGFQIVTNTDKIAVDFVQNETGAFATSPIATTTTSVIRSADVAQLTGSALTALQGSAWSVVVAVQQSTSAGTKRILSTASSIIYLSSTTQMTITPNVSNFFSVDLGGGLTWATIGRGAVASSPAGYSATVTNGSLITGAIQFVSPAAVFFGSSGSTDFLNGYLRKFAIYNSRLPDATLKAKSVVGAPF